MTPSPCRARHSQSCKVPKSWACVGPVTVTLTVTRAVMVMVVAMVEREGGVMVTVRLTATPQISFVRMESTKTTT